MTTFKKNCTVDYLDSNEFPYLVKISDIGKLEEANIKSCLVNGNQGYAKTEVNKQEFVFVKSTPIKSEYELETYGMVLDTSLDSADLQDYIQSGHTARLQRVILAENWKTTEGTKTIYINRLVKEDGNPLADISYY
ncbi:hypothetical protein PI27_gp100 [Listeria phage WIL-1]|uniref:hypothetical protein n=1 Tax=Listeria phage WIL-1 TaxID=1541821 RepID=UPI00248ADA0E|nr:hypothetical protein PI27_gp100 [Listeria phage WIL-1]